MGAAFLYSGEDFVPSHICKRLKAGHNQVEKSPERENVRCSRGLALLTKDHFRWRPTQCAPKRPGVPGKQTAKAEIDELRIEHTGPVFNEDIRPLDVAMDNARPLGMQIL
mmetsp:Transcript_3578/g.9993  ORF Transcript_3578/g.9993 Transcript_3578/m.9993 type:complete len:110 (+) Transcript_3578:877-1206(+)